MPLQILPTALLIAYKAQVPGDWAARFELLHEAEVSTESFSFYTSVASVFSSRIEGEDIELDSYVKHKRFGIPFQPDYTKKIDDLYEAYTFAQNSACTPANLLAAHRILSRNLLGPALQGALRQSLMYVLTPDGRIDYAAAAPADVEPEIEKLFADLAFLTDQSLSIEEAFFYAAALHLVLVKIHPFADGNGRTARLLEKWFLASKLGPKAWFLGSEQHYYQHHADYYQYLRRLGAEYAALDYEQVMPFLCMLPGALPVL